MNKAPCIGRNYRSFSDPRSITKLEAVLTCFIQAGGHTTVTAIQECTGYSRSTIHDCARELVRRGKLLQEPSRAYRVPGTGVESLQVQLDAADRLAEAAEESLKVGQHDGPCDNEDEFWAVRGPCQQHLATAQQRKENLKQRLDEFREVRDGK